MATAQAHAAAPIGQLLVGGGAGQLRCWLPGRFSVEFIASLAGGWLTERGGPQQPSPAELGTTGLAPLADALGTYLRELRFH